MVKGDERTFGGRSPGETQKLQNLIDNMTESRNIRNVPEESPNRNTKSEQG